MIHPFFLSKHCSGDPLLMSYNPYADEMSVFLSREDLVSRQFFYIVSRPATSADVASRKIIGFNSLTAVVSAIKTNISNLRKDVDHRGMSVSDPLTAAKDKLCSTDDSVMVD